MGFGSRSRDEHNPYNVFDFTLGRSRDGPMTFLKDYKETLLADAYGGYDGVVVASGITRARVLGARPAEVRRCREDASANRAGSGRDHPATVRDRDAGERDG